MKDIEIYTDGSSLGNPGPGGWGVVVISNGKILKELGGSKKETTNNQMELSGAIEAIKYAKKNLKNKNIKIHSDSAYVLGGITEWIFNWEKNNWKTANKKSVLNKELWQELILLAREYEGKISWQKVKGHSGHLFNDLADKIANQKAFKQK